MNLGEAGLPVKYCYVPYMEDPTNGKSRPCLILKQNKHMTDILPITSKFKHKPKYLKMWYFKIKNWKRAGLSQPSYIDLSGQQPINSKYVEPHTKGYLSKGACMHMFSKGIYLNRTRANVLNEVRGRMLKVRNNKKLRSNYHKYNLKRDVAKWQEKHFGIKYKDHQIVKPIRKFKIKRHHRRHRKHFNFKRQNENILSKIDGFSR